VKRAKSSWISPGQLDAAVSGDDGRRFAVGERVRGERGQTFKGARASLLRSRGRKSNQWKTSWFRGRHGLKPTMAIPEPGRAGLRRDSFRGGASVRPSEERSALHPPCDRGRQRSGHPVRLPQPMGAGGQQPLRSPREGRLHAAPAEQAEATSGKTRGTPGARSSPRERRGPRPETDSVRTMPPWRPARPVEARPAERLSDGWVNLDRPADK